MRPLSESEIRASFVNASRREANQATLPDLDGVDWDRLEYLGWRDRKAPLMSYAVVPVEDELVGILLRPTERRADSPRRRTVCTWCEDIVNTDDVMLYVARRGGAAGKKGDTIGTLIGSGPLSAREFDYAVSQSPLRDRVQAAAARNGGYLMLTAEVGDDVFHAANLLSTITAAYAADDNGIVVWLPDADLATTDVMYVGDVDRRPAHVWFNTMAARVDAATSIAHTIGVPALGGLDVQLRTSSLDPAGAFKELRSAVAGLLEARTLPAPGLTLVIGSQPHVLTPATSQIGMGNVLDAVPSGPPVPQAAAPAEKPKRKGWFGRG